MINNRTKYLFKNTIIFTIGNLASKLIAFFLIPLYTNILTTKEYGTIDLVITICTIAVPVLTLNIMEGIMRFNLDEKSNKNKITKIGILILGCGVVIGLILIPISQRFNQISHLSLLIYFYVIASASSQIFLADLRGKELLLQYSIGNVLNTFLIAVFNILFLLVFKLGLSGYLLAYAISNLLISIYALIVGKGFLAFNEKIDIVKMREMLKYSIVLIPNSFMWWIMNSSDHIMVTSMIGVAENGIYAISYKLPTLISTFTGIFNQAWSYSAIKENGSTDEEKYNNSVLNHMISIVMIIGVAMMVIVKPFLKIYVQENYFEAWKYTPFLIIGCVYLTLGTFMSTSYTVHKDSKGYLISGSFGALINIMLNFVLIPIIGVYGAAIATCLSYIFVFIFRVFHTRKYIHYHVLTKELIIGTVALIVIGTLMYVESTIAFIIQVIIMMLVIIEFRNCWLPIFGAINRKRY